MGQGIHTKVNQIVAEELGVDYDKVYLSNSCTSKVLFQLSLAHI